MRVCRRGGGLALRIPADLVRALELKVGDEIDLRRLDDGAIGVSKRTTASSEPAKARR